MPIDYRNYPDNWKTEIRPSILKRAENKCEKCGLENYSVGFRVDGRFYHSLNIVPKSYKEARFFADDLNSARPGVKRIVVVLTIAHLNHDITDNREDNLKALCQRCHNVMDAPYRAKNRKVK